MNSWHKICENPKSIELYYSAVPPLEEFDVHEFALTSDGRSIAFAGVFAKRAGNPSPFWDSRTDRVRVDLSLWAISNVVVKGWCPSAIGTLAITRIANALKFQFANADMQCSGDFKIALIERVSSYSDVAVCVEKS